MLRSIMTIAIIAQMVGGAMFDVLIFNASAFAGTPPAHVTLESANYSEPAVRCEFQQQLALHSLDEPTIARSSPGFPRLDLCGPVISPARPRYR